MPAIFDTLTVRPLLGAKSFDPVNTNGAQRGGRPIVVFLPKRIGKAEVLEGAELKPVLTDDFILVPLPQKVGDAFTIQFSTR